MEEHFRCQAILPKAYVSLDAFNKFLEEWKNFLQTRRSDWDMLWSAFNGHGHDRVNGNVLRKDR
jgi:hypothetical protein